MAKKGDADAIRQVILELHRQGMGTYKIADLLGINNKSVSRHKNALGIQRPIKKNVASDSIAEDMLKQAVNRFLVLPWTKGGQVGAVFSAQSPVL